MTVCNDWEEWLLSRPPSVQKIAREFPAGLRFLDPGLGSLWLIGYTEDDELILTRTNPFLDFGRASQADRTLLMNLARFRNTVAPHVQPG
jgi:hypothetical protein